MADRPLLAVLARDDASRARAVALADELGALLVDPSASPWPAARRRSGADFLLTVTSAGLELWPTAGGPAACLRVELLAGPVGRRLRQGPRPREPLGRALGLARDRSSWHRPRETPRPKVLDATAGWGVDAAVMACLGCEVLAVERSAVVAALLRDGLERALAEPGLGELLARKLRVHQGDARELLEQLAEDERPDIVYLDPMYPPRRKAALPRKELVWLGALVGDDADAAELLPLARAVARRRVVVKRPAHAPSLADAEPDLVQAGKLLRFDVYLASAARRGDAGRDLSLPRTARPRP